jgi:hypothetical protein
MPAPLADALFWTAVAATAIAHGFILRSTIRGMRGAAIKSHAFWEWTWAVLPALSLVALFVWTWHTMHPGSLTFQLPVKAGSPIGISS